MGMTLLLLLFLLHLLNSRPTRRFNGMTHSERPACRMHQGTPRVTPKIGDGVVRGIALVCIHQLQTTTNYCRNAGYSGPTHMLGVHNLNARAHFDRGLHAFSQLGRACENGCLRKKQKSLSFEDKSNASLPLPLCRSQQGECWPPPALTSDMLSSLGCSASHLCAHSLTDQMNASVWATCTHTHFSGDGRFSLCSEPELSPCGGTNSLLVMAHHPIGFTSPETRLHQKSWLLSCSKPS